MPGTAPSANGSCVAGAVRCGCASEQGTALRWTRCPKLPRLRQGSPWLLPWLIHKERTLAHRGAPLATRKHARMHHRCRPQIAHNALGFDRITVGYGRIGRNAHGATWCVFFVAIRTGLPMRPNGGAGHKKTPPAPSVYPAPAAHPLTRVRRYSKISLHASRCAAAD